MSGILCRSLYPRAAMVALALSAAVPKVASADRLALVIANSHYNNLPTLPACIPSAKGVAQALRDSGFKVTDRNDLSRGGFAGAIDELTRAMELAPNSSVVVYVCGYAVGMNDRPFVLPVSAAIQRPSDIMTQGILAKTMLDLYTRGKVERGLVALDLQPAPGISAPSFDSLAEVPIPDGAGVIAAIGPPPDSGATPLASALASELADRTAAISDLLGRAQSRLSGLPATRVAVLRMPRSAGSLLAVESPPAPAPAPTQAPVPSPSPPPAKEDASAPPSPIVFPNEAEMTDVERKLVQESLTRLGYYGAKVDGVFGPETRAAIRRFQHEIGADQTGIITGEQVVKLLTLR